MERREEADRAFRLLTDLTDDQRLCVVLRDLCQLSWPAVSFALASTDGATRKLYERATKRLRRAAQI